MRKNRDDPKKYLKRKYNQPHSDMKVPTPIGTKFEEFDLAFTASFRRQNAIIEISLD